MAETFPMQADGKDGDGNKPDGIEDVKPGSTGESAGGAYANPHDPADTEGTGKFDGGQSDKAYRGPGQIDGKPVEGSTGGQGG